MESRKYQLKQQIIEALKNDDDNLYSLLKSQWAHRFGVESLEELKKLELKRLNQDSNIENNQGIDKSQDYLVENAKGTTSIEEDNQEKEIKNDTEKLVESVEVENKKSYSPKSPETVDKETYKNKSINSIIESKSPPVVEALIPLPPKPKYGYLKKWLLRS